MSRRPPLPMPAGFDGDEALWRSLTRAQQEAIIDQLYGDDDDGDKADDDDDDKAGKGKKGGGKRGSKRRARGRATPVASRRQRAAASGRAVVRQGTRKALAPGRRAAVNGVQITVWVLLLILLYHVVTTPKVFAGAVNGANAVLRWLSEPRGIPYSPTFRPEGA